MGRNFLGIILFKSLCVIRIPRYQDTKIISFTGNLGASALDSDRF